MDRTLWVFNVVIQGLLADPEVPEGDKTMLRESLAQIRQIILETKRDAITATEERDSTGDGG